MYHKKFGEDDDTEPVDDGTEPVGDDVLWWYPPREPRDPEEKYRDDYIPFWVYKCHNCQVRWRDNINKRISCWYCGRFVQRRTL